MNENIKEELQRIADDLNKVIEIVERDCQKDKDRYHVGVMVGIGYARKEIEELMKGK